MRTWPCRVMRKMVGDRMQTKIWSTFCGFKCTLFTACSPASEVCGGLQCAKPLSDLLMSYHATKLIAHSITAHAYVDGRGCGQLRSGECLDALPTCPSGSWSPRHTIGVHKGIALPEKWQRT